MINDLFIETTGACNLRCCHCYRKYEGNNHVPFIELKKRILDTKTENVFITGGEALLHPNINDILRTVKEQNRKCILISNGIELIKNKEIINEYVDVLNISLDWPDFRHDINRGRKGLLKTIIDSLKELKQENKTKINILTTVFKENLNEISKIIKISEEIAHNIVLDRYVPIHEKPTPLTGQEATQFFKQIFELNKSNVTVFDPIYYTLYPNKGLSRKRCKQRLFVSIKGEYTICPFYNKKFKTREEAILERENEPLPKECENCEHKSSCHGGCPATRLVTNGLDKKDPYCTRQNK